MSLGVQKQRYYLILACSVKRVRKFRTVLPMHVAEQPGQENS